MDAADPLGAHYRSDHLQFYCFNAAYVYATLVDAYGFDPEGKQITFLRTFGKETAFSVWTLGAVVHFEGGVECSQLRGDEHVYGLGAISLTVLVSVAVGFLLRVFYVLVCKSNGAAKCKVSGVIIRWR